MEGQSEIIINNVEEPHSFKIEDVSSTTNLLLSVPYKRVNWPSSSWGDGSHRSAFQPYRPNICGTVLTNLQRGNTETQNPKQDSSDFSWHQKAGRGDLTARDIPSDSSIDCIDLEGFTALMWASSYGSYSSVQLLLNANASVNSQGSKGETPLMLCAASGHLDVLRYLIANGAKINHTDKAGNTALIYAAYNNHHHCVHELLLNGADLVIKNHSGISAYTAGLRRRNNLVISVVQKYLLSLLDEPENFAKKS